MSEQDYLSKVVEWAEKKKFSELKVNQDGFEQPTQFVRAGNKETFIPDMTAMKDDRKFYIEVATKTEDPKRSVSKWKLLSTLATMKGGKLFLIAPRGHKTFVQSLVKKHDLNARLLYMPNIS